MPASSVPETGPREDDRREASLRRDLRIGLSCLGAGLAMLALFWGVASEVDQGTATATGTTGALLVGYWLLGPVGAILVALGGILSLVSWLSLRPR